MTTLGQLADFAHPQPVAEPGPPLGKAYRGQLSRRQAYVGGEKLLLRPILAGIFAIGQACNASVLHLDEKIGAVTFAIKHHGKTMKQRISPKLVRAWLVRHIIFKARDDVAFQHLQQAWIDGLAHHKKWLAVHGVDPNNQPSHSDTGARARCSAWVIAWCCRSKREHGHQHREQLPLAGPPPSTLCKAQNSMKRPGFGQPEF